MVPYRDRVVTAAGFNLCLKSNGAGFFDALRKDKHILVFIAQLPVCQVDLIFTCIAHHNPLGTQRPGADHTNDLDRDVHLRIQCSLWGSDILINQRCSGRQRRLTDRTIILVIPKQDRAGNAGRHKHIQKQVREESASIHVF